MAGVCAMTKNKTCLVSGQQKQLSLFDLLSQARDERIEQMPGSLCISAKFLSAVKQAIKQAPKSRETIADEMSMLSGRSISVSSINNWTADSHPHDMPSELLHIFCTVCGCDAPLRLLNDSYGLFTLPGPDALRAEIQKLDEQEKRVAAEKRKHKILLQTLEIKS
jgi:hypothetical protein